MRALPIAFLVVGLVLLPEFGRAAPADPPARVERVEITGNKRVEDAAIQVRLRVQRGSRITPDAVDEDIRSIFAMGFFENVEADLVEGAGGLVLTYRVVERPFLYEVSIEGDNKIDKDDLEEALKVKPNTIFDPEKARQGIVEAKKLYDKKGYLDAEITYELEPPDADRAALKFKIEEEKIVRIQTIDFEGNRAFSDSNLRGVMTTKEEWFLVSIVTGWGNLDRDVLATDMERLTAFYYENGYIDARIDEPVIVREEDGLKITVKVEEGEVYQFGDIGIDGDVAPQAESVRDKLGAQAGDTFRASHLREDINKLTEVYGDLGYAFVNITPETAVNPQTRTVAVQYRVSQGPEVTIDRIEITGNTKTRDKVIRRELEVEEQTKFSGSRLKRSQDRLKRLGFFEDVNVTTRKADGDDRLDLLVDVKEASTGSFAAGAGLSSGENFLFNVRLAEINLFGRGQRISLNADFGAISRNISLSFTEPYFLDTDLTLGADVFNWQFEFDDFTRGGTGGGIRTLYPLSSLGVHDLFGVSLVDTRLGLEYRLENSEIRDVRTSALGVLAPEIGEYLISSIVPRIFRDTRNHPFDPTDGSMQDLSVEIAGLGGDRQFLKAESRGRWYYPFYKSPSFGTFTLSTGFTFGYGFGFGERRDLPLFERYFPGGINTIRGFSPRSLGPKAGSFGPGGSELEHCDNENTCAPLIDRVRIGGSQQLIFNNEFIFPIVEQLGLKGVFFFDAGQAYTVREGIDLSELRMSVGPGVRWLSPIGPLRIEIGFPLNPRVGDDRQTVLFSFGGPP